MKDTTIYLRVSPVAVFETWSTYAMIASGLLAMFLMQNALQAGRLIAAQPGITLADPGEAILWGVLAFREQIRGGFYTVGTVLAGLAVAGGVVILSRSPLLHEKDQGAGDQRQEVPLCEAS